MAITTNGDTVNYNRGGVPSTAEVVVAVSADGSGTSDLISRIGDVDDAAWNGTDPNATVISLLKAIATNTAAP
jgi:hypothetical protein